MKKEEQPLNELKVTQETELLAFLLDKKVKKSRNAVKSLLAHKQIIVNKQVVSQYNFLLKPGDAVIVQRTDHAHDKKLLKGLKIVFEDDYLVVIDKEEGLLSIATEREKRETAYSIVSSYIKKVDPEARIFVLHRLDRETSGLMMFAKNEKIQEIMQKKWDELITERTYQAVVEGQVDPKDGTITSWLTENKNFKMFSSPKDNGGQKSITHYKTLATNRRYSLLSLKLDTGRKNQIRVQLESLGHPIVGDKKYGSSQNPLRRMALHAYELSFIHPITSLHFEFKSLIPSKMKMLLEKPSTTEAKTKTE
ncbi:MAG: pseudouridine synthase, RluA family [Bacteroidetes bacterium]|nr:pseudouridine synthase, RluA family [Bacteroidota bacterium]